MVVQREGGVVAIFGSGGEGIFALAMLMKMPCQEAVLYVLLLTKALLLAN